MEVSILQENLNKGFSIISKAISSRTTLPILGNVLLACEEGKLKLTATNLEVAINIWLPAKKEKTGEFTVPAKDLGEFIASLPQGKVTLKKDGEKLLVTCGSYKAMFNGLSAAEYPKVPSFKNKTLTTKLIKKVNLEAKDFIEAVGATYFAAANDETRPVLTGIRISAKEGQLELVATDGYRLSLKKISLKEKIDLPTLIIPAQALNEVAKTINFEEEGKDQKLTMVIVKDTNQVIFSYNNIEVVARLIEGEYPDFEKIIPDKGETKIICDREELEKAIRAAAIFARRSSNIVKFKFSEGVLRIKANAPEVGENEISLPVKVNGKGLEIAFNFRFLQDFLGNLKEESFVLELSGSLKPGMFRLEKDPSFLHIIMPVRVQE